MIFTMFDDTAVRTMQKRLSELEARIYPTGNISVHRKSLLQTQLDDLQTTVSRLGKAQLVLLSLLANHDGEVRTALLDNLSNWALVAKSAGNQYLVDLLELMIAIATKTDPSSLQVSPPDYRFVH